MGILDRLLQGKAILKWLNHRNLYLLGLATVISGLGWSNILMSIGQFILVGNWIISLNFKQKVQRFLSQKVIAVFLGIFALHLIGLLWTENIAYGIKDIRVKLPLLILPLVIGTSKGLTVKEWKTLLIVYVSTLFLLTLASLSKYLGLFGYDIVDKRELSIYISHIRYGLNIALAALLLFYFRKSFSNKAQLLIVILILWFIICLLIFSLLTGFLVLCFLSIIISFKEITKRYNSAHLKEIIGISIVFLLAITFFYVRDVYKDFNTTPPLNYDQNDTSNLYTENGELYWSEFKDQRKENGVYVRRFIAWKEIEREWNKRSEMSFWHQDLKGQTLDQTLNRYLSSKGLKKDSAGISQLSDKEINAIERGIANQYFLHHNSFQNRIFKTLFEIEEYRRTGIADGFSLALRYEYWQTARSIINKNKWIGVGTGDIKESFKKEYELNASVLGKKYRKRSHNQYLTIWSTFGIIGLSVFLMILIFPFYQKTHHPFYLFVLLLIGLSFLTEDTLETQAGASLFALFTSLFLFGFDQFRAKISR